MADLFHQIHEAVNDKLSDDTWCAAFSLCLHLACLSLSLSPPRLSLSQWLRFVSLFFYVYVCIFLSIYSMTYADVCWRMLTFHWLSFRPHASRSCLSTLCLFPSFPPFFLSPFFRSGLTWILLVLPQVWCSRRTIRNCFFKAKFCAQFFCNVQLTNI